MASSSKTIQQKPKGFLAVDIETTGKTFTGPSGALVDGKIFAVGLSYGTSLSGRVKTKRLVLDIIYPMENDLNANDSDIENLKKLHQIWRVKGYEQRCLDEFWADKIDIFIKMLNPEENDISKSLEEFVEKLNALLEKIEKKFSSVTIISDTLNYDTTWLNYLLQLHGFKSLGYSRQGAYRYGIEKDSYVSGILGMNYIQDNWNFAKQMTKLIWLFIRPDIQVEHDHLPENDAKHHLIEFLKFQEFHMILHKECHESYEYFLFKYSLNFCDFLINLINNSKNYIESFIIVIRLINRLSKTLEKFGENFKKHYYGKKIHVPNFKIINMRIQLLFEGLYSTEKLQLLKHHIDGFINDEIKPHLTKLTQQYEKSTSLQDD